MEGNRNIGPLRDLQKVLWEWTDESFWNEDKQVSFLILFLGMFIEKVCYNLAGDVPDVEGVTGEIQLNFNASMGKALLETAASLRDEDFLRLQNSFVDLGASYLDAVRKLNSKLP